MYVKKVQKANCVLLQLLGGFLGLSFPPGQNSISVKCTAVTRYTKVFFQLICALAFFQSSTVGVILYFCYIGKFDKKCENLKCTLRHWCSCIYLLGLFNNHEITWFGRISSEVRCDLTWFGRISREIVPWIHVIWKDFTWFGRISRDLEEFHVI